MRAFTFEQAVACQLLKVFDCRLSRLSATIRSREAAYKNAISDTFLEFTETFVEYAPLHSVQHRLYGATYVLLYACNEVRSYFATSIFLFSKTCVSTSLPFRATFTFYFSFF